MKSVLPATFQFQESMQSVDSMRERQFVAQAENKKLEGACKDFEAILLNKLLTSMRETVPEGGLFEKSFGEKIYQSMLDEEMTRQMAHGKGIGLGELLYRHLSAGSNPAGGDMKK